MKIHTKKILLNDTTATHRVLAMRERESIKINEYYEQELYEEEYEQVD